MQKTIITFLFLLLGGQQLFSQEGRDLYLWNTTYLHTKLNPQYNFRLSAKVQYLTNSDIREMTYLDVTVSRKVNDWLNLGLAFRTSQHKKLTGDKMQYRPQLVTTMHWSSAKIKYSTTNRPEYLMFSEGDSYGRFYHNIFVHFSSFGKWPKPYIGEELFTKLNREKLHLGRIYGGLHVLELQHFRVDVYYAWQQLKVSGQWRGADVAGLNLHFFI
jgi:hypothetical protein